jgi:hypothetical protein
MVSDIRDVLQHFPSILPELRKQSPQLLQDVGPTESADALVRFLIDGAALRPWETVQLVNDVRVVVVASPLRHQDVEELLTMLRRLADTAVVMNARIYEVDRAFFTKHVAPLFAVEGGSDDRPVVFPIQGPLLERLTKEKLVLQSEDVKLRPHQRVVFLSLRSGLRFAGAPDLMDAAHMPTGAAATGVSFEVRPRVSLDRRSLRLELRQTADQLVAMDKVKTLDLASGKEVEVECPNIRKTSVTQTIQVADTQPILMPVNFRPAEKDSKDKVWLLVARPFIWIEEEVQEVRKGGGDVTPQSVWDSEVPKGEVPPSSAPALP